MADDASLQELRQFLHSRCGSVKALLCKLNPDSSGQVSSEEFYGALQQLGYPKDPMTAFRSLDTSKDGFVSLRAFMTSHGGDEEKASPPAKEALWTSARVAKEPDELPRLHGHLNGQSSEDKRGQHLGSVLKCANALRKSTIEHEKSFATTATAHQVVAGADLLYSRMARLEEQLAAEQRLRFETEQRLTQHLNTLVGVSISEQLDALREQVTEERMSRQVEVASLSSRIELTRSCDSKVDSAAFNDRLKDEVDRSVKQSCSLIEHAMFSRILKDSIFMDLQNNVQALQEYAQKLSGDLKALRSELAGQISDSTQTIEQRLYSLENWVEGQVSCEKQSFAKLQAALESASCIAEGIAGSDADLARVQHALRMQGEQIDALQQRCQGLSELIRTKLQALIIESLVPVLHNLGLSLQGKQISSQQSLEKTTSSTRSSTFASVSLPNPDHSPFAGAVSASPRMVSSSTAHSIDMNLFGQRKSCSAKRETLSTHSVESCNDALASARRRSSDATTDSSDLEALRLVNLRLREENIEMRERAATKQEEALQARVGRSASPCTSRHRPMQLAGAWTPRPTLPASFCHSKPTHPSSPSVPRPSGYTPAPGGRVCFGSPNEALSLSMPARMLGCSQHHLVWRPASVISCAMPPPAVQHPALQSPTSGSAYRAVNSAR